MSFCKVLLVMRDPRRKGKSVEGIYGELAEDLKESLDIEMMYYNDSLGIRSNIREIRKRRPSVVHVTSDMYYLLPLLPGVGRVMTIHDIGRFKELRGIRRWMYKWLLLKIPAYSSDAIIVVSEFTKSDFLKYIGRKFTSKITVVYNAIPCYFKYTPKQFNSTKPVILQVGTAKHKNLDRVICALRDIPCELVVIGELSGYQHQLLNENNIEYKQLTDLKPIEVYQQYVRCDLVAFISSHEGFGMPVIEAHAVGRPIICSRICSLPEIAGQAALYVDDEKSIDEIREKICALIADQELRQALVEKGLENVKRFDRPAIKSKLMDVYTELRG